MKSRKNLAVFQNTFGIYKWKPLSTAKHLKRFLPLPTF
jgi:hypothetical protein